MELLTPDIGVVFWLAVVFLIVSFLLKKYAWGPILSALDAREKRIEEALRAAEAAREELRSLKQEQERLLEQAKQREQEIIAEAKKIKETIIEEAKEKARLTAQKIIAEAEQEAYLIKEKALSEFREYATSLVISLTETILRKELQDKKDHEKYIQRLLSETTIHVAGRN